ncbi:MAG: purine-nucleoside phosphorylase [Mogibacterium sp.]|nr:purine-nucleoside phosphorylase [Mogibacterium sp.]
MSTAHNAAMNGEIAKAVLLPGDPLRAKFIADNFLEDVVQFNDVRNMLGFTGTYKGKKVSVMGTGMGCASIGIYSYELIHFYGVDKLIRVGSCGAMQPQLELGDLVMAITASTDSNYAHQYNLPGTFSAGADFDLLRKAVEVSEEKGYRYHVGNILSADVFYNDNPDRTPWMKMGTMAVEMESFALYCNAARAGVKALGIMSVSDSILTGKELPPIERQNGFTKMMEVALETAIAEY